MRGFTFLAFGLISSRVFAAGYNCLSVDQDTQVIVSLSAADAPMQSAVRPAEHLTFIDPTLSKRSQVLAVFSQRDVQSEAISDGLRYTADASVAASGKHLGGTRASLLEKVVLEIQTISKRLEMREAREGSTYAAQVSYIKKDGQTLTQDFDCALFLGDDAF